MTQRRMIGSVVTLVVVAGVVLLIWWTVRDEVKAQWADRDELASCGSVDLAQGEELRDVAADGIACLRAAMESGTGAELAVTYPTVEGDPVTTYYRVLPDGTTELYEDNTEDAYGSGEWGYATCADPQGPLDGAC